MINFVSNNKNYDSSCSNLIFIVKKVVAVPKIPLLKQPSESYESVEQVPGSKSTAENNLEESKSFAQTPVIQSTNPGQDLLYLDYLNTQKLFESEEEQENSEASDDDYIMNTSLRKDVINKTLFRSVRKQFRNFKILNTVIANVSFDIVI